MHAQTVCTKPLLGEGGGGEEPGDETNLMCVNNLEVTEVTEVVEVAGVVEVAEVAEVAGVASVVDTANIVANTAANVWTVMNCSGHMEMCNILLKDKQLLVIFLLLAVHMAQLLEPNKLQCLCRHSSCY